MFYYLPLGNLGPEYRGVTVDLVFDLPQITIGGARRNPFVIDLLEHPYVHTHLLRNDGDDIHEMELLGVYNKNPHSYRCQEIKIVYQNNDIYPNHGGHREFVFSIYACISEAVTFPEPELFFTVRDQYDYYLDLFVRDQLVIPHVSVHQPPFHLHNYLCVKTGITTVEVGVVNCVNDNQGLQHVVLSDIDRTEITITNENKDMINPIRLTDELLIQMGFVMANSNIYRYPVQDHFDISINVRGVMYQLCMIRRGQHNYELLVEDARTTYGAMAYQVRYLHELQIQIRACYQYDFTPNPGIVKQYLQQKRNDSHFAANYWYLINAYYDSLNHPMPTRTEFISNLSQYYEISLDLARNYTDAMIIEGEIMLR